jgi:hypothetical protein
VKRVAVALLLAFPFAAHAGLIDSLTDEQRQLQICRDSAAEPEADHDYARAAGVWQACLDEMTRLGYQSGLPMLRDQVALSRAMAAAAEYRTSDPDRFAQDVLSVAARQSSATYPTDAVADVFRAWMETEAGRARLAPLRTITLDWGGSVPQAERAHPSEVFRRHVEALGLKWAEPGSDDVDVIVFGRITVRDLDARTSSRMGSLARAEATLTATRVRFRRLDRTEAGFTAVGATEDGDAATTREEALDAACERAAAQVLKAVLRVVFE